MKISQDAWIRRCEGPVETQVGSEVVLMSLEAGECYGLGETGSDVWRLLAEPIRFDTLTAALRQQYQAPEGVLEEDVEELLDELTRRNLVRLD